MKKALFQVQYHKTTKGECQKHLGEIGSRSCFYPGSESLFTNQADKKNDLKFNDIAPLKEFHKKLAWKIMSSPY